RGAGCEPWRRCASSGTSSSTSRRTVGPIRESERDPNDYFTESRVVSIGYVRFPVVLFDLDGTIVDSGWMILASYRHATATVLGTDFPDEVLLARVGAGDLEEQMREFDPEKADELAHAYREFYYPLHSELQAFPGMLELLRQMDGENRTLGIVSAKR